MKIKCDRLLYLWKGPFDAVWNQLFAQEHGRERVFHVYFLQPKFCSCFQQIQMLLQSLGRRRGTEFQQRQTAVHLLSLLHYNCLSPSDLQVSMGAAALRWPVKHSVCMFYNKVKISRTLNKMDDQRLCALDTHTHIYTRRDLADRWAQTVETNLYLMFFFPFFLFCLSPSTFAVLSSGTITHTTFSTSPFFRMRTVHLSPHLSELYVCLCESYALYKVELNRLPWGLWPNMVLFHPHCSHLNAFQQCCHYKVQRSAVIAWLGSLTSVSVCLCLLLTVIVYDNRMERKMLSNSSSQTSMTAASTKLFFPYERLIRFYYFCFLMDWI